MARLSFAPVVLFLPTLPPSQFQLRRSVHDVLAGGGIVFGTSKNAFISALLTSKG